MAEGSKNNPDNRNKNTVEPVKTYRVFEFAKKAKMCRLVGNNLVDQNGKIVYSNYGI